MSLTHCSILVTRQTERTAIMTAGLYRALNLSPAKNVRLQIGSKQIAVPLKVVKRRGSSLVLPYSVAEAVKLPRSGKCMIQADGGRLKIGPLIGIMTNATGSYMQPFGPRTGFVRQLIQAGADKAFFIAFSPQNVNWKDETVAGYMPDGSGKWTRKTVPLPDVVYNRLANRSSEKSEQMENFKERFLRRNIPLFNWSFFDKWDVYRLLENDANVWHHIPETHHNPTGEQIRTMLELHRVVYLKPTGGCLGYGIYKLTYNPNTRYYYARFRRGNRNVLLRLRKFDSLMTVLRRHQVKMSKYVVQQGIPLIEMDRCPIDFRFHLNKNGKNQWVVAGVGAKKAGRGSVTTHVRTGGELMTPERVLNAAFGSRADSLLTEAKRAAIELAEAIEANYPRTIGELGLDLGIDRNGNIWMFEANAKPGRTIFKHPSLKAQGQSSLNAIFEHCLYLSGFSAKRERDGGESNHQ